MWDKIAKKKIVSQNRATVFTTEIEELQGSADCGKVCGNNPNRFSWPLDVGLMSHAYYIKPTSYILNQLVYFVLAYLEELKSGNN